jgi:hypothetical protein
MEIDEGTRYKTFNMRMAFHPRIHADVAFTKETPHLIFKVVLILFDVLDQPDEYSHTSKYSSIRTQGTHS